MCSTAATDLLDVYQAACGKQSNVRHSGAGWARSSLALFAGRFDVAGRKAGVLASLLLAAILIRAHARRRRSRAADFAAHGEAARRFSPGPAPPFEDSLWRFAFSFFIRRFWKQKADFWCGFPSEVKV